MGLVQHVLEGIEDGLVRRLARHGEAAIANAMPIEPLLAEQQTLDQREAWGLYHMSPRQVPEINLHP